MKTLFRSALAAAALCLASSGFAQAEITAGSENAGSPLLSAIGVAIALVSAVLVLVLLRRAHQRSSKDTANRAANSAPYSGFTSRSSLSDGNRRSTQDNGSSCAGSTSSAYTSSSGHHSSSSDSCGDSGDGGGCGGGGD